MRDASDLADLLRMGRLPEAWIAPPYLRQLREFVRYRAKLVALRSGLKAGAQHVYACAAVKPVDREELGPDTLKRPTRPRMAITQCPLSTHLWRPGREHVSASKRPRDP